MIGIIGDLHFGVKENNEKFLDYQISTIKYYLDELKKRNIKDVVFLGDITDKRISINYKILYLMKQNFYPLLKGFDNVYIIAGNHDCFHKTSNDINSIRLLFEGIENIHIIDTKPLIKDRYVFCPWISSGTKESVENTLNSINPIDKVLFGHFEIKGFQVVKGVLSSKSQIDDSLFSDFKKVISGHFHLGSEYNNIIYVGSAIQMTWNDSYDKKRIAILNDNDELEYIYAPETIFKKLEINEDFNPEEIDLEIYRDKVVKLILNIQRTIEIESFIIKLSEVALTLDVIDNTILFEEVNIDDFSLDDIENSIDEWLKTQYRENKKHYKKVKTKFFELLTEAMMTEKE